MPADDRTARFGTARVFRLGAEPPDDLRSRSTAAERLAMVDTLTREAWELSGLPVPDYERRDMPVRVVDRGEVPADGSAP